jgi:hypothetical protein
MRYSFPGGYERHRRRQADGPGEDQSAGTLDAMRRLYGAFHGYNPGLGALCLALFLAALISGQGLMSFAFLFAAVWWAALGTYWGRRSSRGR